MLHEVMALALPLQTGNKEDPEILIDMIVAPSHIVRAFASFLANRTEEEEFIIKNHRIKFEDCSITVGDSKKAVMAYRILREYNMPLSNHEIFASLIKKSPNVTWKSDSNFKIFEKWFSQSTKDDNEDDYDDDTIQRSTQNKHLRTHGSFRPTEGLVEQSAASVNVPLPSVRIRSKPKRLE
jgi:hypothetical protein